MIRPTFHVAWLGSKLLADQPQVLILISLNMIMDSFKNGRLINPFKKFSRLRVKEYMTPRLSLNEDLYNTEWEECGFKIIIVYTIKLQ